MTHSLTHLNARSLRGKFDLFTAWVLNYSPDVIGVTETWATDDILDSELALVGYDMFRQDRPVNRAGVEYCFTLRISYRPQCMNQVSVFLSKSGVTFLVPVLILFS